METEDKLNFLGSVVGETPVATTPAETPEETPAEPVEETPTADGTPETPVTPVQNDNWMKPALKESRKKVRELSQHVQQLTQTVEELRSRMTQPAATTPNVPTEPIVFNEPDPLEQYKAKNGEDAAVPPDEVAKHTAWLRRALAADAQERERQMALTRSQREAQEREAQQKADAETRRIQEQQAVNTSFSEAADTFLSEDQTVEGLDLRSVYERAQGLLTEADERAIAAQPLGPARWNLLWRKSIQRIHESSPEGAAFIKSRLDLYKQTRQPATPPPESQPQAKSNATAKKTPPSPDALRRYAQDSNVSRLGILRE